MRDLQEIIKESVERYGLKYDENQKILTVKGIDGKIREVRKEDISKMFNFD
jgi:hypothetical protein